MEGANKSATAASTTSNPPQQGGGAAAAGAAAQPASQPVAQPAAAVQSPSQPNPAVAQPNPAAAAAVGVQQPTPMDIDEAMRTEALRKRDAIKGLSESERDARAAQYDRIMKENEELRKKESANNERETKRREKEKAERWAELAKIKAELIPVGYDYEKMEDAKKALDEWADNPDAAHFGVKIAVNNARAAFEASKKKAEEAALQAARQRQVNEESDFVTAYWGNQAKLSVTEMDQAKRAIAQRNAAAAVIKNEPKAVKSDAAMTDAATGAPASPPVNPPTPTAPAHMPPGPDARRSEDDIALIRAQMGQIPSKYGRSPFLSEPVSPAAMLLDSLRDRLGVGYSQPIEVAQGADGTYATGEMVNVPGYVPGGLAKLSSELARPRGLKDVAADALLRIRKDQRGHHFVTNPWTKVTFEIEKDICPTDIHPNPNLPAVDPAEVPPQVFTPDVMLATMSSIYRSGEGTRLPSATWSNGFRGTLRDDDFRGYNPRSYDTSLPVPVTGKRQGHMK